MIIEVVFWSDTKLLSILTDRFLSLWGVGSSETDADAVLIDLEPQAALLVIFGELAQLRVFFGISQ